MTGKPARNALVTIPIQVNIKKLISIIGFKIRIVDL